MNIKLEPWAKMPTRAHLEDAGLDLYGVVAWKYIEPFKEEE